MQIAVLELATEQMDSVKMMYTTKHVTNVISEDTCSMLCGEQGIQDVNAWTYGTVNRTCHCFNVDTLECTHKKCLEKEYKGMTQSLFVKTSEFTISNLARCSIVSAYIAMHFTTTTTAKVTDNQINEEELYFMYLDFELYYKGGIACYMANGWGEATGWNGTFELIMKGNWQHNLPHGFMSALWDKNDGCTLEIFEGFYFEGLKTDGVEALLSKDLYNENGICESWYYSGTFTNGLPDGPMKLL